MKTVVGLSALDLFGPRRRVVLGAVAGAVAALGHSPVSWPIATLLGLGALFWLFGGVKSAGQATLLGWAGGTGYFAATVYWIVNPFLVDAADQAWMAPFALVFMAVGLALFWAAAFWLAYRVGSTIGRRRVALVVALALAGLARSYVLTGFPWGLIGYVWVETPVIELAAYIGPHGVGVLTLVVAALPFVGRRRWVTSAFAVLLIALAWGIGQYRLGLPVPAPAQPVTVRLIQPNAPQRLKWDPAMSEIYFRRQLRLTAQPAKVRPDLVIWPETAVTFWLEDTPKYQTLIANAAGPESRVIIGALRAKGRRVYNALAVLGPDGAVQQVYDKSHLVPFGEYVPFGDVLADLGFHGMASSEGDGLSPGPGPRVLDLGRAGKILPLICYEAIFPQLVNRPTTRADWILQITNDAWFGKIAGPQQHMAQARVRAIEQGLPLIRVANTGISAAIDAKGQIVAALPLGVAGKLDVQVPGRLPATLYRRTGDWPVFLVLLFGLGVLGFSRRAIL